MRTRTRTNCSHPCTGPAMAASSPLVWVMEGEEFKATDTPQRWTA